MTEPMSMRPDQHITHPMTYTMTDPQMKTIDMTMDKTRVQNCDVRAVSHSCNVFGNGDSEDIISDFTEMFW